MKKYLLPFAMAALVLAGCEKYDDSALKEDIKNLQTEVDQLKSEIEKIKTNITSIQGLIASRHCHHRNQG